MGTLTLRTTRFGEIAVPEDRVYTFAEGLLGFAAVNRYVLIDTPAGGVFQWLQAVESGSLAFLVCDPRPFFPDYRAAVRPEDLASIGLSDVNRGMVLVILTVPPAPAPVTANLLGPLVFNVHDRRARQVVLSEGTYTTRHPLPVADSPSLKIP